MADYTYDPGLVIDDTTTAPVRNATGTLHATPGGAAVAVFDILGTPIANLTSNADGYVARFSANISRGYANFGSVWIPVTSDQVQDSLAIAEAAASDAAAALAVANAASAVATAQAVDIGTALEEASAAQDAAADAIHAAVSTRWLHAGADLVDGSTGEWLRLPLGATIVEVSAYLDGAPSTATEIDLQFEAGPPGSGGIISLYGVTPGSLPAGQSWGVLNPPSTTELGIGSLRTEVVTAPPAPSGGGTAATVVSGSLEPYSSGSSVLSSHPVPKPTGGATGDHVFVVCSTTNSPASLPAGYSLVLEQISDPTTPQNRLTVWTAAWSAGLAAPTVAVTGGAAPMDAVAFLVRGADSATPIGSTSTPAGKGQNSAGASFTSQSVTTNEATDLALVIFATRFGANIDGYTVNHTGGPTGLTQVHDTVTSRVAATNVGLWVGTAAGAIASGATPPTATGTVAGGTGSTSNVTWNSITLIVKKGAGVAGATELEIQVSYR